MKKITTILSVALALGICNSAMAQDGKSLTPPKELAADTLEKEEVEIIDDVVKNRRLPKKDQIQYFSQVTRYGFKNLFANNAYNSKMPYSGQMNGNATSFIDGYMRSHGKYLEGMKTWGLPYFNLIENILMQYGLPKELKYIAVIESNLQTGAVSNKGAGGPWQFMPATARQYNLVINNYTDERTDYYKSTHAAAKYLLSLYQQLKDWLLVMAAYNGGPGRVFNAIRQSGSKDFWVLQNYLPEESRTYVKRFIATHYIMEGGNGSGDFANTGSINNAVYTAAGPNIGRGAAYQGDQYQLNKPNLGADEMQSVDVLGVTGKFNSAVIAKNLSMEMSEFNRLNPNFDNMLSNTGNYDLRLPSDKMQLFVATKYQILNECVQLLLNSDDVNYYKNQSSYPKVKSSGKKKRAA